MCINYNFDTFQGSTEEIQFDIYDTEDLQVDLLQYSEIHIQVKRTYDSVAVLTLTKANGFITLTNNNKSFVAKFRFPENMEYGNYLYDVDFIYSNGLDKHTEITGTILVKKQVTKQS